MSFIQNIAAVFDKFSGCYFVDLIIMQVQNSTALHLMRRFEPKCDNYYLCLFQHQLFRSFIRLQQQEIRILGSNNMTMLENTHYRPCWFFECSLNTLRMLLIRFWAIFICPFIDFWMDCCKNEDTTWMNFVSDKTDGHRLPLLEVGAKSKEHKKHLFIAHLNKS